jgi:pilus assembly protein CpaB
MTSVAVGRVNRRFLLLALILATLSAVLAYAAMSQSGGGSSSSSTISVVVAKDLIPSGTEITSDLVEVREFPTSAVGEDALRSQELVVGKVARFPISANEQILASKIVGTTVADNNVLSHIIEPGARAVAIQTQAVIGAGGLVLPGDHIDILWVPEGLESSNQGALVLASDVEVLAVQQTLEDVAPSAPGVQDETDQTNQGATEQERVRGSEAEPIPDASTVTIMLNPAQAQMVFCAEVFGTLRLTVHAFGDASPILPTAAVCPLPPPDEATDGQ